MGWTYDAELGVKRVADLAAVPTKIDPVTFRGVDCTVLAERYVAFRRNNGMDEVRHDPDEIKPIAATSSPENV